MTLPQAAYIRPPACDVPLPSFCRCGKCILRGCLASPAYAQSEPHIENTIVIAEQADLVPPADGLSCGVLPIKVILTSSASLCPTLYGTDTLQA